MLEPLSPQSRYKLVSAFFIPQTNRLGYAKCAISETDAEKFEVLRNKLVKYEDISDKTEYEIATFLNALSTGYISEATSIKIKAMYKIIGELESLGDSGEDKSFAKK